jgi:hypothetical protein
MVITEILYCLVLFVSGVVTDIIWALYVKYLSTERLNKAAWYAVGTGVCSIIFVEGIIHSIYSTIFWLIGLYIGTYYSKRVEQLWKK